MKKVLFFSFVICVVLCLVFYASINIYANEIIESSVITVNVVDNWYDILINILNLIVVVFNFIFVIHVFKIQKKDDENKEKRNYEMHWYKKFIIDDNIILLDSFFDELEILINNSCQEVEKRNNGEIQMDVLLFKREAFQNWTVIHNKCKSKFCEKIDVVMPLFGKELRSIFRELQDFVTANLSEVILCENNETVNSKKTDSINKCYDIKKILIKKLYEKGKNE